MMKLMIDDDDDTVFPLIESVGAGFTRERIVFQLRIIGCWFNSRAGYNWRNTITQYCKYILEWVELLLV